MSSSHGMSLQSMSHKSLVLPRNLFTAQKGVKRYNVVYAQTEKMSNYNFCLVGQPQF